MTNTPGPWWNEDLVICAKGPDGHTIYPARVYVYEPITREEARGNANIFAASLDLLAALEARMNAVTADEMIAACEASWAALAKARGE